MPLFAPSAHDPATGFLYSRIDYERAAAIPYDATGLKLDRMLDLLSRLDNPLNGLPVIHIAGTKGKGSTAAMLAAVLTAAGYRTGLFSSPHLRRIEERIIVDGRPISQQRLGELVERVRPQVEAMDRQAGSYSGPTFFEVMTALAFLHFRQARADIAVLEVGLGGRLDSTNVCLPLISVITSISLDHTRQLGTTLAEIAGEKAGIIKPRIPVVSGTTQAEPAQVIRRRCIELQSPLLELGRDFTFRYDPPRHLNREPNQGNIDFQAANARIRGEVPALAIGLPGAHQAANAAVAVAALRELAAQSWRIPEPAVRRGLSAAQCPSRIEIMSRWPTVVCDAAHNVASIEALLGTLEDSFDHSRRILVFATTQDKDFAGMLERLLPAFDELVLTRYVNNPRGVAITELQQVALRLGYHPHVADDPMAAWSIARQLARRSDLICITGSFYLATEMHPALANVGQALAAAHD